MKLGPVSFHCLIMQLFVLIIYSPNSYTQEPEKGAVLLTIGGGVGSYDSKIKDLEIDFVEENGLYVYIKDMDGNPKDTLDVEYTYMSIPLFLSASYFTSRQHSFGLQFRKTMINQSLISELNIEGFEAERLLDLYQLGPTSAYWLPIGEVVLSFESAIGYTFGSLHRIPVFANTYSEEKFNPADIEFINAFHQPVDVKGFCLSLGANIGIFTENGLYANIGAKYEYTNISIDDNVFLYIADTGIHSLQMHIVAGFSTYMQ